MSLVMCSERGTRITELQNKASKTPNSSEKKTWSTVALPLTIAVIIMLTQVKIAIPQAVAIAYLRHLDCSTGFVKVFL
jgi:hypothetical protein